ncbi:hypothetical protein BV25DRAFT_1957721 [Artomyces pyxidatus]|uniref:Uncharacterized protein n=1 Tax=Artomyces pyxidatus TaxID=48021 RepID=A0ACB8SEH5_9AGAM|nr:hypothetical protein BV25DRAFT_1957721 [Artomyces pyxidatus]
MNVTLGWKKATRKGMERSVTERLLVDEQHAAEMNVIPDARMSTLRFKIKDLTDHIIQAQYEMFRYPADEFTTIVNNLVTTRRYIYPGDAVTDDLDEGRPYCHPFIIAILKASIYGPKAFFKLPRATYQNEKTGRLQAPAPLVALAATAAEAGLKAFQLGPTATKIDFKGDHYEFTYKVHLGSLEKIRRLDEEAYEGLLGKLYDDACGTQSSSAEPSGVKTLTIAMGAFSKNFK